jgi:hypothetical protein
VTCVFAQADYPSPTPTFERLFYIQRSANYNTIVYDANFSKEKELGNENPIKIYWITYEKGRIIEELNFEQKKLAYGISISHAAKNYYEFTLVAYSKLKFILELDNKGKPYVKTEINGRQIIVHKIFIKAAGLFKPKIKYIEFFGTHLDNNEAAYEKITP